MTASILDPATPAERPENNLVLTAPASEWAEALRRTAHLGSRHASPVVANVLIEVVEEWATFTTFDYEIALQTTLEVEHKTLGPSDAMFLVPHAWFSKIIRTLTARRPKDTPVTVRVNTFLDHELLTVECSGYSVPIILKTGAQEFPAVTMELGPVGGPMGRIALPADTLLPAMKRVMTAACVDDTLPILTCLHLVATPGKLRLEATDRYRLATDSIRLPEGDQSTFDVLLPARIWRHLIPSIRRSKTVSLEVVDGGQTIRIDAENFSASILATAGKYPDIQTLFRDGSEDEYMLADREELGRAVRILRELAGLYEPLQFDADGGQMSLSTDPGTTEAKAMVTSPKLPVQVSEHLGTLRVAFNPGYLLEGIAAVPGEKLKLSFKRGDLKKPMQISDAAGTTRNPATFKYLVMPVRMPVSETGAQ